MRLLKALSLFAASVAFLPACVNIDYEGDKKLPKAGKAEVKAYFDKSQIPAKDYKVMGRAIATAPSNYTASEVERKLIDSAEKYGADGVLILSIDKIPDGNPRDDQIYNRSAPGWNVDDSTENGWQFFRSSIEDAGRKSKDDAAFKVKIKALFLDFPDVAAPAAEKAPAAQEKVPAPQSR